jgi:hypothetical protein
MVQGFYRGSVFYSIIWKLCSFIHINTCTGNHFMHSILSRINQILAHPFWPVSEQYFCFLILPHELCNFQAYLFCSSGTKKIMVGSALHDRNKTWWTSISKRDLYSIEIINYVHRMKRQATCTPRPHLSSLLRTQTTQ